MPFSLFLIDKEHRRNPNHTNVIPKDGGEVAEDGQPRRTRRRAARAARVRAGLVPVRATSAGCSLARRSSNVTDGRSCYLLGRFVNVGIQPRFLILLLRGTWGLLLPREEREHRLRGAFRLGGFAWGFGRTGNLNCRFSEAARRSVKIISR